MSLRAGSGLEKITGKQGGHSRGGTFGVRAAGRHAEATQSQATRQASVGLWASVQDGAMPTPEQIAERAGTDG